MAYERMFDDVGELVPLIFQAVGAASVAWHDNGDGKKFADDVIFDEYTASNIASEVIDRLRRGVSDAPGVVGLVMPSLPETNNEGATDDSE